jgi:hypothetical protein
VSEGYQNVNKEASVGKSRKNVITAKGNRIIKVVATKKPRTGCGGCSRRRSR